MQPIPVDPNFVTAFWSHVDTSAGPDACWPFLSPLSDDGYGIFTWQGPAGTRLKYRAHRLALTLTVGPPPPGRPWALHKCRVPLPACCNASHDHLYWGTPAQNSADRDHPRRRLQRRLAHDDIAGQLRLLEL